MRPRISVVMPVRNESATIHAAVASIQAQSLAADEVIVADGQSDDGTRMILEKLAEDVRRIRIVDNPDRTIPMGLNAAIHVATGDVIARLDGHNVLPTDYLERCVAMLERDGVWAAGGVFAATGTTMAGHAAAHAMHSPFGVGGGVGLLNQGDPGPVDGVPLGVFRRAALDRIGPFDPVMSLSEDDEFFQRLRDAGGIVWCDPTLRVTYLTRSSLRALAAKHYRWGMYKVLALWKQPGLFRLRHAIPLLFVVALIVSLALLPWAAWPIGAVAGSWVIAASVAALRVPSRRAPWPMIVAAFAAMHLSYGTGMIVGAVRWLIARPRATR